MKKLFTSLLLLGVALCSWGAISVKSFTADGVLTLTSSEGDSFTSFYDNLTDAQKTEWYGSVTKLVLDGAGFTNADFNGGKMGEFIANCAGSGKTLYLDLTNASGLVSKVTYTSTETNPVKDPQYIPSGSATEVECDADYETKYYYDRGGKTYVTPGVDYTDDSQYPYIFQEGGTWKIKFNQNDTSDLQTEQVWYYTYNGSKITIDNPYDGKLNWETKKYRATVIDKPFAFGIVDQNNSVQQNYGGTYINGITFPKGDNFTAIPEKLCCTSICPNLETVVWGDQLEWIGANAFRGGLESNNQFASASELKKIGTMDAEGNVTFPTITLTAEEGVLDEGVVKFPSTLKVIGLDAFYECTDFRYVNLDLPNLVKVDAAAFNMYRDNLNQLDSVQMPSKTNTSLKFWGNQVFSSSHVKTLDFRYCEGIKHFAYDGTSSMGEMDHNPVTGGQGYNTFYWHHFLKELILPPNLEYISCGDENSSIAVECPALETIRFTGVAKFNDEGTALLNGFEIGPSAFVSRTSLKNIYFAENSNIAVIGEAAFSGCTGIQTVSMGGKGKYDANCNIINPLVINKMAFFKNTALENLTLSDNITIIGEQAFDQTSSLGEVSIPASVQTIKTKAFNECPQLTKVVFEDTKCPNCDNVENMPQMLIEGYAFMNAQNVLDVFINNRTPIICTNKAFAFDITFGQSNVNNAMATLHYPEGQEEHYTNLGHYLTDDIAADPGKFQRWLVEHFAVAQDPPSQNGWHEFVNSGPSKADPDPTPDFPEGVILRTFSEVRYACIVPEGIKAFVVNGVKKTADGQSYELSLYPVQVIPAKTGVILYGQPNARDSYGNPTLSMTPVRFAPIGAVVNGQEVTTEQGKPLRRENWKELDDDEQKKIKDPFSETMMTERAMYKNYLMPTSDDEGNGLDLGPTERDANNKVIFRNFAMQRYSNTENLSVDYPLSSIDKDFVGFFRCLKNPNKWPAGYAYLRLSAVADKTQELEEEFTESTGAEIIVNQFGNYYKDFKKGEQNATLVDLREKGYWTAAVWNNPLPNWGKRSNAFSGETPHFIFTGEMEEETDGVVTLTIPADENSNGGYYTLQGVKVNNPTKGVYILNGKKVVIK